MRNFEEHIEDFILGREMDAQIRAAIEQRIQSDKKFAREVEEIRHVIEGLQLSGLSSRIKNKLKEDSTAKKDKRGVKSYGWLIALCLVGVLLICYFITRSDAPSKNNTPPVVQEKMNIEPPGKQEEAQPVQSTEQKKHVPHTDSKKQKEERQEPSSDDQSNKNASYAPIALNYFEKRLPLTSISRGESDQQVSIHESALEKCLKLFSDRNFSSAELCLNQKFGKREEDAQWFRALVKLAQGDGTSAKQKVNLIANDRLHIYSRQATALLLELK